MGKQLSELPLVGVNKGLLGTASAANQQKQYAQSKITGVAQPAQVSFQLVNNDEVYRYFSLLSAGSLDRSVTRFAISGDDDSSKAVVTGRVTGGGGAIICDISVALPAGVSALKEKLKKQMAVVAAIGFNVTADANVDNYTRENTFWYSHLKNLSQIDVADPYLKNQVNANTLERTQLVWEKQFQCNDDNDIIVGVKPGTIMQVTLQISHYGITPYIAKD